MSLGPGHLHDIRLNSQPVASTTPAIGEAYQHGREHLAASGSAEAALEAEVLLRHALQFDRAGLYTRWEQPMPGEAWACYRRLLQERATGRPVPYVIGEREFMGMSFVVDERVMIPRPETEILVEFAAKALNACEQRPEGPRERGIGPGEDPGPRTPHPELPLSVVDVGTGGGCIAVSLASLLTQVMVYAIDISAKALEVARVNAARHHVHGRVEFLQGDLLHPLPPALRGRVDAIVSNPPYVPMAQRGALPREIRDFEPPVAVCIDGDGTAVHRRLIAEAPGWLHPGGLLVLEVGAGQAEAVADAMRDACRYARIHILPDYARIPRVVTGELMA